MSKHHEHHSKHDRTASKSEPRRFPREAPFTDYGNAERLVLAHGHDLRFFHRQWHVWDGYRFAPDQNGEVKRRAKATVRKILMEAHAQDGEERRKQFISHQQRSESSRAISAMLALAESEKAIAARGSDFDRDLLVLNVLNGTLDLRTGYLRKHDRSDLITKLAPVEFDPNATAPRWERFLHTIMNGDVEKIDFLRCAIGYTLTGDVSEDALFLLHGTGANGKSTFLEVLRALFGGYSCQSDFSAFLATKGNAIRNDIARLRGARFVTAVESPAGQRLAENVIKQMTGGDTVTARYLYKESFEFIPQCKLWLATNHKPRIIGTDDAIWRRIRLVPFTIKIPKDKQDKTLTEKLKRELPGILNWALEGLEDWRKHGLAASQVIDAAGEDYRQREDSLGRFLKECTISEKESKVGVARLYEVYKGWAVDGGEFQLRMNQFSEALEARGLRKNRGNSGVFWKGVSLRKV